MILAVDVENTSTTFGFYKDTERLYSFGFLTRPYRSVDEYTMLLKSVTERFEVGALKGAIISSVVPPITEQIRQAVEQVVGKRPIIVGHGLKTGVNIRIDNHTQLGSDIVSNIAAAACKLDKPFAVFDLGTATTVAVVNEKGEMPGVMIVPGVALATDALSENAAELPHISLGNPVSFLGKNTAESMKSGSIYGTAAMIDGLIERLKKELGFKTLSVIACGELAEKVIPYCENEIPIDKYLTLDGINRIYLLNKRERKE